MADGRRPQGDAQKLSGVVSEPAHSSRPVRFYDFDGFRLDARRRALARDGVPIAIQPKALDTLLLLVQHRDRLLDKEELMRSLWPDTVVEEANLTQNVFVARKALGEAAGEHRFIVTVARQGYRFVGDVREVAEERDDAPPVRVAVLPFANHTANADHDYLADGLADEVIATLGRIDPARLVVIGRTSTNCFRGSPRSLADIGRELDVAYLLESSIHADHDRIRVITGLVNARDQVQLWSQSYERDLTNALTLQQVISAGIAEQVRTWLSPPRPPAVARRQTTDPRAYDAYLRGRFAQRERTPAANAAAVRFFEEATALDPDFALAWCGLSDIYANSGINGDGEPAAIAPRARDAATRAIAADSQLAESQTSIAWVRYWFDWDWPAAEAAIRRAMAIDPGHAGPQRSLAFVASGMGRHAEALAASERSIYQDPLNPINHAVASEVAFRRRDHDMAVIHAERSRALDPRFWIGSILAAQAHEQLGAYHRALDSVADAQRLSANNSKTISLRGYILAKIGRIGEARAALDELAVRAATTYVPPYAAALIHAGLGAREAMFDWLERACAIRDIHLVLLGIDPKWDPSRDDSRFASLLARCGFTARG